MEEVREKRGRKEIWSEIRRDYEAREKMVEHVRWGICRNPDKKDWERGDGETANIKRSVSAFRTCYNL